ncbi:uncharacterized protein TNIN_414931 [Trichonephila inaurata madagascariensis]|uniref:EGF-like domain-containing protein n=1 Tax=Trichonephila inaurata madagascariensis TaxID=2747483 RepID=A0A8X7CCR3_9ARAC|nr:uncharacterized protein TNIN_414931 [Trichonephila inaurata madagascariensis]
MASDLSVLKYKFLKIYEKKPVEEESFRSNWTEAASDELQPADCPCENGKCVWNGTRKECVCFPEFGRRTSGLNESSVVLRQPEHKKRSPEVKKLKRGVPSSLSENQDREGRPPNRSDHKRGLLSSISSNQVVRKRNRRTEENNGQVLSRGSRLGPAEERPLQSSRIQPGGSSSYNLKSREQTRKAGSRSSDRTVQAKEGPVQSRRDQSRRSSSYNLRRRHQSRQGVQDPEDSLASRRSSSFEVHIGDIAERRLKSFRVRQDGEGETSNGSSSHSVLLEPSECTMALMGIDCDCGRGFNCTFKQSNKRRNWVNCICTEGYYDSGSSCRAICNSTHPCQNGGTCQDGRCKCMEQTWGDFCENIDWCSKCTPRHVVDCVYDQKKKESACLCKNRSLVYDYIEQVCKLCPCGEGTCKYTRPYATLELHCDCNEGYKEFRGHCKKCDCGPNSSCEIDQKTGERICKCEDGFVSREGRCVEILLLEAEDCCGTESLVTVDSELLLLP